MAGASVNKDDLPSSFKLAIKRLGSIINRQHELHDSAWMNFNQQIGIAFLCYLRSRYIGVALTSAKKFIREDVESNCSELYARLQLEVSELEKTIQRNDHEGSFPHGVNHPFSKSIERLNSAKMELA
ncbi:hypothetical protein L2E82_20381 [Cichorium intybus]|uniref:Uncharacterized protein n=1 Tax=Cichorium intybus TaxID=13427 RepID=A0ACB9DTI7_CICIN|nr:hypothetical protein L2E82_20381 [Cichorium intybus]